MKDLIIFYGVILLICLLSGGIGWLVSKAKRS